MADNVIRVPFPRDPRMAVEIETLSGGIILRWVGCLRYLAAHPVVTEIGMMCLPLSLAPQVAAALWPDVVGVLQDVIDGDTRVDLAREGARAVLREMAHRARTLLAAMAPGEGGG